MDFNFNSYVTLRWSLDKSQLTLNKSLFQLFYQVVKSLTISAENKKLSQYNTKFLKSVLMLPRTRQYLNKIILF